MNFLHTALVLNRQACTGKCGHSRYRKRSRIPKSETAPRLALLRPGHRVREDVCERSEGGSAAPTWHDAGVQSRQLGYALCPGVLREPQHRCSSADKVGFLMVIKQSAPRDQLGQTQITQLPLPTQQERLLPQSRWLTVCVLQGVE